MDSRKQIIYALQFAISSNTIMNDTLKYSTHSLRMPTLNLMKISQEY